MPPYATPHTPIPLLVPAVGNVHAAGFSSHAPGFDLPHRGRIDRDAAVPARFPPGLFAPAAGFGDPNLIPRENPPPSGPAPDAAVFMKASATKPTVGTIGSSAKVGSAPRQILIVEAADVLLAGVMSMLAALETSHTQHGGVGANDFFASPFSSPSADEGRAQWGTW